MTMTNTVDPTDTQLDLIPETPPEIICQGPVLLASIQEAPAPGLSGQFVKSIETWGVLVPVLLTEANGHQYRIVAGRRRCAAARKAGLLDVPATVLDGDASPEAIALIENGLRSLNPVAELEAIQQLIEEGSGIGEIAKATGLPKSTIQRRLVLANLHPVLYQALTLGQLAVGTAEAAAKLLMSEQEQLVEQYLATGKLTQGDIAKLRQVGAAEAAMLLPEDLFGPVTPPLPAWVEKLVAAAEALVRAAAGTKTVISKNAIRGIADALAQRDAEAAEGDDEEAE